MPPLVPIVGPATVCVIIFVTPVSMNHLTLSARKLPIQGALFAVHGLPTAQPCGAFRIYIYRVRRYLRCLNGGGTVSVHAYDPLFVSLIRISL